MSPRNRILETRKPTFSVLLSCGINRTVYVMEFNEWDSQTLRNCCSTKNKSFKFSLNVFFCCCYCKHTFVSLWYARLVAKCKTQDCCCHWYKAAYYAAPHLPTLCGVTPALASLSSQTWTKARIGPCLPITTTLVHLIASPSCFPPAIVS